MKERQRRREGARRAQESQRRLQAQRQRQRRRQQLLWGAGVLAVAGAIVALVLLTRGPNVGEAVPTLAAGHEPPYTYSTRPPTSGRHLPAVAPYGYTTTLLQAEAAVHNMEHGAVVIWFQPGDATLAGQVRDLVAALGRQCLVAGPYATMDDPIAVTAWGRILRLDAFDAARITEFVEAYRGRLGPEGGACRQES